jgi:hypothetical protein
LKRKKKYKGRATHGVYAKNFPRSVSWMIDQDYLDKLTPAEREWLSDFNDRHYGADFRGDTDKEWSVPERREAYGAKNRANRDAYTIAEVSGRVTNIPDFRRPFDVPAPDSLDLNDPPDYLASDAYRVAREELRQSMPQRGVPTDETRLTKARAQIERLRLHGENFPEDDVDPTRDEDEQ